MDSYSAKSITGTTLNTPELTALKCRVTDAYTGALVGALSENNRWSYQALSPTSWEISNRETRTLAGFEPSLDRARAVTMERDRANG